MRIQTLSYHLIVHGFCQTICLEKDSFWEVVFKTIHWKKDMLGEIVAGDEMEMFCAASDFKGPLCLNLLERGAEKFKSFCTDFLKECILKITIY